MNLPATARMGKTLDIWILRGRFGPRSHIRQRTGHSLKMIWGRLRFATPRASWFSWGEVGSRSVSASSLRAIGRRGIVGLCSRRLNSAGRARRAASLWGEADQIRNRQRVLNRCKGVSQSGAKSCQVGCRWSHCVSAAGNVAKGTWFRTSLADREGSGGVVGGVGDGWQPHRQDQQPRLRSEGAGFD